MGFHNPDKIIEVTEERKNTALQAQALTAAINNRKYRQADVYRIATACAGYIEDCQRTNKPLTVAGFILAAGIPTATWYEMRDGKHDAITAYYQMQHNYTDDDGQPIYIDEATGEAETLVTPSEIVKRCYLVLQNQLESNCYNVKAHNVAGSIFGLKAQFNWNDDTTPQQVTQNLVICDAEQAKRALKLLAD